MFAKRQNTVWVAIPQRFDYQGYYFLVVCLVLGNYETWPLSLDIKNLKGNDTL